MIITFLDKVSKKHTLQYLLTLIDDILTEDPSRIGLFLECSRQLGKMSWETFLHIVETKEDLYVQHQANRILVKIAVDDSQLMPAAQMQIYFAWVLNAMQSTDQSDSTLLALASLQTLLRQEAYRRPFFEYADSIHQLKEVLKANPGSAASIQPQYMVMVVLWVMTFDSYVTSPFPPSLLFTSFCFGESGRGRGRGKLARTLVEVLCLPNAGGTTHAANLFSRGRTLRHAMCAETTVDCALHLYLASIMFYILHSTFSFSFFHFQGTLQRRSTSSRWLGTWQSSWQHRGRRR